MPKRSVNKPYFKRDSEKKLDTIRKYSELEKSKGNIDTICLERPHYGIAEPKKEAPNAKGN